jgi:hypothetical protein
VGADGSEDDDIVVKVKGETVFHGDGTFPAVFNALQLFDPE